MDNKEVVNRDLEKLEDRQARLPNGEMMDLYSIKEGVLLYGTSLEGDEYIRSPLFYSPGEAILHALNPAYLRDTIGVANPERPANSSSSSRFRFESRLRLREYRFDSRAFFYDSRGRLRPICLDVGVSSFKTQFYLRLPLGSNRDQTQRPLTAQIVTSTQGMAVDDILDNIVSGKSAYQTIRIEAFHFCQPGKTLRIDKSFLIEMSVLWTFYAALLSKGYSPLSIRSEAFLGEKSKGVLVSILRDQQTPTTIGDLPEKISKAVANNASLEDLARECSATPLGQKTCVSGVFFKRLWDRDLLSILQVYSPSAFLSTDKLFLHPFPFVGGNRPAPKSGRGHRPLDPYVPIWLYKEDLMEEMGRDVLTYNWNYNRFLDVNTVIYWILWNLQAPVAARPYQKPNRSPFLLKTDKYDPTKHLSLVKHRFTSDRIASMKRVSIYDSAKETVVTLSFDPKEEDPSLTQTRGLYIRVKSIHQGSAEPDRGTTVQQTVLNFLRDLPSQMGGMLEIVQGARDAMGKIDPHLRIISFLPGEQTIDAIPTNWLVLPFVSSFLRYLVRTQEFEFFVFE